MCQNYVNQHDATKKKKKLVTDSKDARDTVTVFCLHERSASFTVQSDMGQVFAAYDCQTIDHSGW